MCLLNCECKKLFHCSKFLDKGHLSVCLRDNNHLYVGTPISTIRLAGEFVLFCWSFSDTCILLFNSEGVLNTNVKQSSQELVIKSPIHKTNGFRFLQRFIQNHAPIQASGKTPISFNREGSDPMHSL